MTICPISYQRCEGDYSSDGLKSLSPRLKTLAALPFTAAEQLREAAARASKMSIQGVQPKLSARLNVAKGRFEIVDTGGRYILKPQTPQYEQLPENEDLSMRLAAIAGVETPLHGLIYSKDASLTYFIKRFDRVDRNRKRALEDFAQILGLSRDTKYDASMEKVAFVIDSYCTFPVLEKIKLFRLTLVNFLIGNEDMHLKNFSLITRDGKIEMSPAYDILNTTIALAHPKEQTALPVKGKKNTLTRSILVDYYGREYLGLNEKVMGAVLEEIESALPEWKRLISVCFLNTELKKKYLYLLDSRWTILL